MSLPHLCNKELPAHVTLIVINIIVPMDRKSTPNNISYTVSSVKNNDEPSPSKLTLNIIRQFARGYKTEPKLPGSLSGIILN